MSKPYINGNSTISSSYYEVSQRNARTGKRKYFTYKTIDAATQKAQQLEATPPDQDDEYIVLLTHVTTTWQPIEY